MLVQLLASFEIWHLVGAHCVRRIPLQDDLVHVRGRAEVHIDPTRVDPIPVVDAGRPAGRRVASNALAGRQAGAGAIVL